MCRQADTTVSLVEGLGDLAAAAVLTAQAARAIPFCCPTLHSAVRVRRQSSKTAALDRLVLTRLQRSTGHRGQKVVQAWPVRVDTKGTIPSRSQEMRLERVERARVVVEVLALMARRALGVPVQFTLGLCSRWASTGLTAPAAWQAKTVPMASLGPMVQTSVAAQHLRPDPAVQAAAEGKAAVAVVPEAQAEAAVGAAAASQ